MTRPKDDETTNFLYYWTEKVLTIAKKKCFRILDLAGDKAGKKNFISYVNKNLPGIIFFNGHGSAHVITGHNKESLIESNNRIKGLKGTIIYARSCKAGLVLGKKLVEKGVKAFIGYSRDFIFARDLEMPNRPLDDQLAKYFLKPSNLVPIFLLKGHSAEKSHKNSRLAMLRNFRYMVSARATYQERSAAFLLWNNYRAQILHGDGSAHS